MALGRKNVSVARANSGPDIFRLAGLLGDDNLIRHELLAWRIGRAIRTYSELVSLASYLLTFDSWGHAPKPWRRAARRRSTPEAYEALMRLVPYKRIGEPDDIVRAAVWLASDESDYVKASHYLSMAA